MLASPDKAATKARTATTHVHHGRGAAVLFSTGSGLNPGALTGPLYPQTGHPEMKRAGSAE